MPTTVSVVAAVAVCGVTFAAGGCDEAGSSVSNATAALCAGASDAEPGDRRRFHPHVTWAMVGAIVCLAGAGVARVYVSRARDWFHDPHHRTRLAPMECNTESGVEMGALPAVEAHAVVVGSAHGASHDVAVARPIVQGVSLAGSNRPDVG